MPLLGKFSRGSSANQQSSNTQTGSGFQSTSRGPKPPTTAPNFASSSHGASQTIPSGQGFSLPNLNYTRKSSRSPSSFFPILPRKVAPQNLPPHGTSQQPPPTSQSQTQTAPFVTQQTKTASSSISAPVLETRATDTSRSPASTSTWRNLFTRSSSREKPQSSATAPASYLPTSSRAPSSESLAAVPSMARQRAPINRVFEGVNETKSSAVRPVYASSGSKSSLTSGSVPSLLADVRVLSQFLPKLFDVLQTVPDDAEVYYALAKSS